MNINPRDLRLILHLLNGPLTRKQADAAAPASNGPHYVMRIRRRFDLAIPCERVPWVDSDGRPGWYGRYQATKDDRTKMRELVAQQGGANDA